MSDSFQPYGVAHQAPVTIGFSRLEYWGGMPSPPLDVSYRSQDLERLSQRSLSNANV